MIFSNRTKAIVLIVLGAVALVAAIWLIIVPLMKSGKSSVQQPPPLVSNPAIAPAVKPQAAQPAPKPADPNSPAEKERQAQEKLKQQASDFAVLIGTYSNTDGFDSLREAGLLTSADLNAFLLKQRDQLLKDHPRYGPSWGQTTVAISSRLVSGAPLLSGSDASVLIQTQREITSDARMEKAVYEEATITFKKDAARWVVTRIEAKTIEQ